MSIQRVRKLCRVQRKMYRRSSRMARCVCIRTTLVIAHVTANLINLFGWDVITHPSYSPDVVLSDYHLFPEMKKHLGGTHMYVQIFSQVMQKIDMQKYTIFTVLENGEESVVCRYAMKCTFILKL